MSGHRPSGAPRRAPSRWACRTSSWCATRCCHPSLASLWSTASLRQLAFVSGALWVSPGQKPDRSRVSTLSRAAGGRRRWRTVDLIQIGRPTVLLTVSASLGRRLAGPPWPIRSAPRARACADLGRPSAVWPGSAQIRPDAIFLGILLSFSFDLQLAKFIEN
jgi:hypothetical protein